MNRHPVEMQPNALIEAADRYHEQGKRAFADMMRDAEAEREKLRKAIEELGK